MIPVLAPAKLNLYLRVVGRRTDGYHELETVFERIDLCDELSIEPRPSRVSLVCDEPMLACGNENLIMCAARLLQDATGCRQGAAIRLAKRIPIAAGLGGGSSDAAAALMGLNALWQLGLDVAALMALGQQLGADVPFFLADVPFAIGRERGDACELIEAAAPLAHVLAMPEARISTREAFEAFDAQRRPAEGGLAQDSAEREAPARLRPAGRLASERPQDFAARDVPAQLRLTPMAPSSSMVRHALSNGSLSELADGLWNDLEPEAIRRCPITARIQSQLRAHGCVGVLVSGSGPAVFGLCRDAAHAQHVISQIDALPHAGWRCQTVRTYQPSGRTALRT